MTKTFSPSHFIGDNRDQRYLYQNRRYWNMLPICIHDDHLNMCSEPFVMALDVRAA